MEYHDTLPGDDLSLYVSLSVFSTMAVVLRLIARIKTKTALRGDDWWACLGLIFLQAFLGLSIWVITAVLGRAPYVVYDELVSVYKVLYACGLISILTITAAKISVILLYRRAFLPDNDFRVASNIVGVLCLLWGISCVFVLLFQCIPIQRSWNPEIVGSCINGNAAFLASEILDCVLDFAIILLPMRVVRKLKLPLTQKIILCFIFIMGSFVGLISIIRMARVYKVVFFSGVSYGQTNWLPIQLAMAVICCCLPTYRPLLPSGTAIMATLVGLHSSIGSFIPRKQRSANYSANGSRIIEDESSTRPRHNHYNNLSGRGDESGTSVWTQVICAGAERVEDIIPERDLPMNAISVTKTVDMV